MIILTSMESSLQIGIDKFWGTLKRDDGLCRNGTAGGFCKARAKLKHTLFKWLADELTRRYDAEIGFPRWRGYRLLGIDGSTVCLPELPSVREHFDTADREPTPMARISQLTELHTGAAIDVAFDSNRVAERDLALDHLEVLREGDLVVLDRGYPASWFFDAFIERGAHFIARVPANQFRCIDDFSIEDDTPAECIVEIEHSYKSKAKMRLLDKPIKPLRLRLVRVRLNSGKSDVLVTNLFDPSVTPEDFAQLYAKRWQCEISFRYEKCWAGLEHFTGKSIQSIHQEFFASVVLFNLAMLTAVEADQTIPQTGKQHRFANRVHLIGQLRSRIVLLFFEFTKVGLKSVRKIIRIAAKTTTPQRPDRIVPPHHAKKEPNQSCLFRDNLNLAFLCQRH